MPRANRYFLPPVTSDISLTAILALLSARVISSYEREHAGAVVIMLALQTSLPEIP
jgi:hypothetical protein